MNRRPEAFWRRVLKPATPGGCWLWTGPLSNKGHGSTSLLIRGRRVSFAHRVAYELLVGPIPRGLHLDHLCKVRHCVNPAHLEPVTPFENYIRSDHRGAIAARRGTCEAGHPHDPARFTGRKRYCVQCHTEWTRARRARLRAAALAPEGD